MRRAYDVPYVLLDGVSRPKTQSTHSWCDKQLVIREGENILANYDDEGAHELQNSKLTYRHRRKDADTELRPIEYSPYEVATTQICDMRRFRLFALSLLWRCCVTNRPEFIDFDIRTRRVDALGEMLVGRDPATPEDFPAYLGVFDSEKELTKLVPSVGKYGTSRMARFFLDGFILYVSALRKNIVMNRFGDLIVGGRRDRALAFVFPSRDGWHDRVSEELIEQTAEKNCIPHHPIYG